ncbi:SpaA isopeptide-forming pilin-related protein [Marinobacterium arenosum]|uniref:SpaA isopeptide-forming pilin-related protein n=1 Tax=Marinobacterium arenosum TaxID=2862496 RepID=UPI001C963AA4|nr:SpaA isopeptide-forming pilin-related protein [Marinobacterium arenosum]MBY4678562.1 hypothetical protein [Marinobacterium arenosum]
MNRRFKRCSQLTALIAGFTLAALPTPSLAANLVVSLPGSSFEIDMDANLKPDADSIPALLQPSLDWSTVNELRQPDTASGSGDDSFGKGAKEDDTDIAVVSGSIPPNKSDLKEFGIYQEGRTSDGFLHLFWTRVQDPSGTTNMDFEFNQSTEMSNNGITPLRTAGDLLITYDLSKGGTEPVLSLREWDGNQWGAAVDLSGTGAATGSINVSFIPASESDGLGSLDPRTFGEASLDLSVIFDSSQCESFGSAHLKSRSSDSFTSAMKDFIAPLAVDISNCGSIKITKADDANQSLAGAVFELYADNSPYGPANPGGGGQTSHGAEDVATGMSCETGDDGICYIQNVLQGRYWMVETGVPEGHDPADDQNLIISAEAQTNLMFINDRQPATLNILKEDDTGAVLAGAEFTLYDDDGTTVGVYDAQDSNTGRSCTTEADGRCSITDILPPGDYCLVETGTPEGYDSAPAQCFPLALNQTKSVTFTNNRQPATLNIVKVDDAGAALAGAQFTLYHDDGTAAGVYDSQDSGTGRSCTTDAEGLCAFTDILPAGSYCVVETVTPDGYDTAPPQCTTLALNDTVTLTFVNDRQPASVVIRKEDEAGNLLPGAQFSLYVDNQPVGQYNSDGATPDTAVAGKSCTSDASGICTIDGILPAGNYCIVETVTPDGYVAAEPHCEELSLNETLELTIVNDRQPATVTILKKDDGGNLMSGVQFSLYVDNPPLNSYNSGTDTAVDGKVCTTDGNGVCTIDGILPAGAYCLVETLTPAGYASAPPQCVNLSLNQTVNLEFTNPRLRGAILITKTRKHAADGPGDHPHAGVIFTISGGGLASNITLTTDDNGQACVDNLLLSQFGGNYSVTETLPAGYQADGPLSKPVSVDSAASCGSGNEARVSFANTPLSNITVAFVSQVPGGTVARISCGLPNNPVDNTPADFDDTAETSVNLGPGTYNCTIEIAP